MTSEPKITHEFVNGEWVKIPTQSAENAQTATRKPLPMFGVSLFENDKIRLPERVELSRALATAYNHRS